MASTAERLQGRKRWVRRRRRGWRLPSGWLKWGGGALLGCALLAGAVLLVEHWRNAPDPDAARGELIRSLQYYRAGDMTAARGQAAKAAHDQPDWGIAQALLGRFYLATGDGRTAEVALDRARAAGFDPARLHHLYAEALLLEDQPDQAIDEAGHAAPRYADYATRVIARAQAAQGDLPTARATLEGLLARAPGNADAWTDLGRVRWQSGDVAGAIAAVGQALALDDRSADALTLKGELVRSQYGLVAALPWFDAALKVDPGDADTLLDKAATLGDLGRYRDMLAATRQALVTRPDDPQALYLQAVLAARAGQDKLARDILKQTDGAIDDMPGAQLLSGVLAVRDGDDQAAIDVWRQLLDAQPFNLTVRRLLGAALLRSNDVAGALDVLRPMALRGDADSYTLTLVARAFEMRGQRDWAAKFLNRAADPLRPSPPPFGSDQNLDDLAANVDSDPGDPLAELDLIRGYIEQHQLDTALAHAQALVRASPGSPDAQLILGDVLWASNRLPDATAAYSRAANLRFDEPTMLRLVDAYGRTGQPDAARHALALFLSQNPQDIAARRLAAHWQIAAQDWDAAIDTLEGLRVELGNRDAAILGELALAYAEDGDPATGRRYGAAAYRLAPMNPAVVDAYGWALAKAGDADGARQLLAKAASLAPGDAGIAAHLASVTGG